LLRPEAQPQPAGADGTFGDRRDAGYIVLMATTLAPKIAVSLAAIAILGGGAALWAKFGGLVYFDMVAASFIGCFF
jgi:hypothetical protein